MSLHFLVKYASDVSTQNTLHADFSNTKKDISLLAVLQTDQDLSAIRKNNKTPHKFKVT